MTPDTEGTPTFRKVPASGPERDALKAEARTMLDAGTPQRGVAEALGISRGSLRRLVALPGGRVNGYEHPHTPTLSNSPDGWIESALRNAGEAVSARDLPRALLCVNRARDLAAIEHFDADDMTAIEARIAKVLEPLAPAPPPPPPPRVKAEHGTIELRGKAVDQRLVTGVIVALGLAVVVAAVVLVWQEWQAPVEGEPEAEPA